MIIASKEFEGGRLVIKSIEIEVQRFYGISKGFKKP
jgi:hypothetical protein